MDRWLCFNDALDTESPTVDVISFIKEKDAIRFYQKRYPDLTEQEALDSFQAVYWAWWVPAPPHTAAGDPSEAVLDPIQRGRYPFEGENLP